MTRISAKSGRSRAGIRSSTSAMKCSAWNATTKIPTFVLLEDRLGGRDGVLVDLEAWMIGHGQALLHLGRRKGYAGPSV